MGETLLEFVFRIEIEIDETSSKKWEFKVNSLEEMASWIVPLDSLVSASKANSFDTFVDPIVDKVKIPNQINPSFTFFWRKTNRVSLFRGE